MSITNTAKGTRDFSKDDIYKRNFIFDAIRSTYETFGFAPLETPAMENIETLTGKYGDEGDQLLFRILKSGNFLKGVSEDDLKLENEKPLRSKIADKGLRYDLTIPFARFIAKNHQVTGLPFKRYQIQPVWRADRPARGRYREFYQCDADVAGTQSLLSDAEFIAIIDTVFDRLRLPASCIKLNNRKILAGIAHTLERDGSLIDMTVSIDKLDKIGREGVDKELRGRGFSDNDVETINRFLDITGSATERLEQIATLFDAANVEGQKGIQELKEVLSFANELTLKNARVEIDFSLARGLNYYTGTIFEVVLDDVQMGSVASGGRYDNLTESFGVKNVPGVGMSFGAERIYDVMDQLDLFPTELGVSCQVLVLNMDEQLNQKYFGLTSKLRAGGIASELYLTKAKIGKQMKFAEKRNIPFVLIAGEEEFAKGLYELKNLETGNQESLSIEKIVEHLNH